MKIRTLLFFILFPFTLSAQWTKTAGPVETGTTSVEIVGTDLFLGTNGSGLFVSTDSGLVWNKVTAYPDSAARLPISKVVNHLNNIYVANTNHIYVSADYGASFQYGDVGLPDTLKNYYLFNVNNLLYATGQIVNPITFNTTMELFYYNDFTLQWQQVNNLPAGAVVTGLAALHDTLYCAVFGHGLYITNNNGFTWDSLNTYNGLLATNNVRLLADDGQQLYAMAYDNLPVLYTSPNGMSWMSNQLTFTGGNTIANMAVSNKTICLGSPGVIYVSRDNGTTWLNTTLPYYAINEAKFYKKGIIAADAGSGFILSPNDTIWHTSNTGLNYSTPLHLAYQYNNVYAMDAYNTFHTNNHGNSWVQDTDRLFNVTAIARMGNKLIGFSKYGQEDQYSLNQGQTWSYENTPGIGILVNNYVVDNNSRYIYAWGPSDIRRSNDYGKTWKSLFPANSSLFHDTLFTGLAQIGTRLLATMTDTAAKFIYSDDSGNHWTEGVLGYKIYHVAVIDTVFVLGTSSGIKKTMDVGATFSTVYGGDLFNTYVNGNTLFNYKGPLPNTIQYSNDYGATWTDISLPDSAGVLNEIIMDDTYLYAATTNNSVWRRSLSEIGLTYTPDTSNNYIVNVGVNMLAGNQPAMTIYPNPFTSTFNISLTLSDPHYVEMKLYDLSGRCVQNITQGNCEAGTTVFTTNVALPAGIYFVTAFVDGTLVTKKVVKY